MNTTNQEYIKSSDRNVGIDVGKDTLDVYVYELDLHWQEQAPPASAGTSNQRTGTASPTSRHLQLQLDLLATKQNAKTVLCQLKTTIKAPIGQSVVLGVTPLDSMTSVFVVQLRPKSALSND